MRRLLKIWGLFGFSLAGFLATGSAAERIGPHIELIPEKIVGVALFSDGETPAADLPIRVWDVDRKKFVYRSHTDSKGYFEVPKLASSSRCYLFVGTVKIDLRMLARQSDLMLQHHDIVVVIPRGMLLTRQPEIYDVMIFAPMLFRPPDTPKIVSP